MQDVAEALADAGMTRAASHANRKVDHWSEEAGELFRLYATLHPEGFMTEDVRKWADKLGFPPPPDNRAWGHVAKRASIDGYVRSAGFRKQKSTACHGSPKTLWTKVPA